MFEIVKINKWEKVNISYNPDSASYIDIPQFREKYCYQIWLSPINCKGAEGMLWIEPPYKTDGNNTLTIHQATCFIDDRNKTPYSIALYNSSSWVYLTDGSTGNNIPINSVRILRQEV